MRHCGSLLWHQKAQKLNHHFQIKVVIKWCLWCRMPVVHHISPLSGLKWCSKIWLWYATCRYYAPQTPLVLRHPTALYVMRSLVASGRAVLPSLDEGTPDEMPSQVLISGVDRTGTYLMTPTTYDLVCEYKRRAGHVVP